MVEERKLYDSALSKIEKLIETMSPPRSKNQSTKNHGIKIIEKNSMTILNKIDYNYYKLINYPIMMVHDEWLGDLNRCQSG